MFRSRVATIELLALALLLPAIIVSPGIATASPVAACPDVSGRYRVVATGAGTLTALSDALTALHANDAGNIDGAIELSGPVDGALSVRTKSSSGGRWSTQPTVLSAGADFECQNGWLLFKAPVKNTNRKTDEDKWYEGEATSSLSRRADGELSVGVRFTGSERISLYRYESADISLPKPGTRTTLTNSFLWPAYSESASLTPAQPVIANVVRDTRALLTPELLGGGVVLSGVQSSGDGAVATVSASRSDDIVAFEDRLRAAAIVYETRKEPTWYNNAHHMELLIRPAGTVTGSAVRPSAFRIEQELQRFANVSKVVQSDDGYLVTLTVSYPSTVANQIATVQRNSTLIGTIELLEETTPANTQLRVAQLRVHVR